MGPEAEAFPPFRVAVAVENSRKEYKSSNLADLSLFFMENLPSPSLS